MSVYKPQGYIFGGTYNATEPIELGVEKAIEPSLPFSSLYDLSFFILGPVYETVNIPFNLVRQYYADTGTPASYIAYKLNYRLIQGLKDWSNIIYALPGDQTELFTKWMLSQVFKRSTDVMWLIKGKEIIMPDPGAIHLRRLNNVQYISHRIFLPYNDLATIDIQPIDKQGVTYKLLSTSAKWS